MWHPTRIFANLLMLCVFSMDKWFDWIYVWWNLYRKKTLLQIIKNTCWCILLCLLTRIILFTIIFVMIFFPSFKLSFILWNGTCNKIKQRIILFLLKYNWPKRGRNRNATESSETSNYELKFQCQLKCAFSVVR